MRKNRSDENPIIALFSWFSEMIVLNFITIICCLPVFTIGAALTAAHFTALKIKRAEGSIIKNYFKSFKENFLQSTALWLMYIAFIAVCYLTFITLSTGEGDFPLILQGCMLGVSVFVTFIYLWVFPLQSKFVNSILKTLRLSLFMAFKHVLISIAMLIFTVLPFLVTLQLFTVFVLFGLAVPVYLCAICYNSIFAKYEAEILGTNLDGSRKTDQVSDNVTTENEQLESSLDKAVL